MMEQSVFHSFNNLVTKTNATREELTLLCNDYPTTPSTWAALARVLPPEEARSLLIAKARELHALDLWKKLLLMEEADVIARYKYAKEAVQSVGHDPRSGVVWAIFLGLYAALHNAFLSLVSKSKDETLAVSQTYGAGNNSPSAIAPLVQLVPAEKSYSERHASTVGNLSISTFFTSPRMAAGGDQKQQSSGAAVENAMLTSPIAALAPEAGALVAKYPPNPESLRALVAAGDLNLVSYCDYLRKLCMTAVKDVSVKNVRQVLSTLMPEVVIDPAASVIQKHSQLDFEATYPSALFQRPTSSIVPELEMVSVPGWIRVLKLELSNWLQIKETDAALFEERLAYFFAIALRQCGNVPDIRFLQAQRYFVDGRIATGLDILQNVPLAARQLELSLVIADVQELLLNDSVAAINTLCKALSQSMHHRGVEYACQRTHEYLLGCLVYRIVLKRLRQGADNLETIVSAALSDVNLQPALTEELFVSLLLLAARARNPEVDTKALLEMMLQQLPYAPILISLEFVDRISTPPDYIGAYVSRQRQWTACEEGSPAAKALSDLLALAMIEAYMLGSRVQDVVQLMQRIGKGMLCTPHGAVDYQEYIRFATALPSQALFASNATLLTPTAMPSPPLSSAATKGVIELGRKLDTLIEIARQVRDHAQKAASPTDLKAAAVLQVFQRAVTTSQYILSEKQSEELKLLSEDPAALQALRVWLNDA